MGLMQAARQVAAKCRQFIKRVIKFALGRMIGFADKHPALKARSIALVQRFPRLEARLRQVAVSRKMTHAKMNNVSYQVVTDISQLTPAARSIYLELKIAVKKNRGRKFDADRS